MTTEGLWISNISTNGKGEGIVKISYPDGSLYFGDVVANEAHGEGVFVGSMPMCMKSFVGNQWAVEVRYRGSWEHNRPNGYGTYMRRSFNTDLT